MEKYPNAGRHTLNDCFRCTPKILSAGLNLIQINPGPNRIEKSPRSLYETSEPPLQGHMERWHFKSGIGEVRAIVKSCETLIQKGIPAREILVLLSNTRVLLPMFKREFKKEEVLCEFPKEEGFLSSTVGRFVQAAIRIACDDQDYVAHRVLLGTLSDVGPNTTNLICEKVIENNLNYRNIFYDPIHLDFFDKRGITALKKANLICEGLAKFNLDHTLAACMEYINAIITENFDGEKTQDWETFSSNLPSQTTLQETREYFWADTDEQQKSLLEAIYERLGLEIPNEGVVPDRVRVMTMHGAKGLSAQIVFIPGLEQDIFPGERRRPYPGLVLEAARLLYVSITRARLVCVVSFAFSRIVFGTFTPNRAPSQFCRNLGGIFQPRSSSFNSEEITAITEGVKKLHAYSITAA